MTKRTCSIALLGLCLAASAATAADDPAARAAAPAAPAVARAADAAAQVAANPIPVRDDNAAVVIVNADGSSIAVPDASIQQMSVVRLGPDGTLIIGCVNSREEYNAFFLAETQPTGPEVR